MSSTKTPLRELAADDQKLISLRLPSSYITFLKSKSKKEGRTVSNYLRFLVMQSMDETDFLLSNDANREMLLKSKAEANMDLYSITNLNLED